MPLRADAPARPTGAPSKPPVALVTGGAVRVGRAIVLGLAGTGWDLVVHYHSSEGPARELQTELSTGGRRVWLVRGDLGATEGVAEVARAVREGPGRLDLLVNSAANFHPARLLETTVEEWDEVLAVNTRAPHLLTRALAELLCASPRPGGGAVVNICDQMGMAPRIRYGAHSVSKAALAQLTRVQARALAPEIRVNAVVPGFVLPPDGIPGERLQAEIEGIALGRIGSPEDVAQAVLYLAEAGFVTGQLLVVDGGATLGG